jgi:hypothetical protein
MLIALALASVSVQAHAAPRHARPSSPDSATAAGVAGAMGAPTPAPTERLTAALTQIGMTTCAATVMRAAHFIIEDGEANFTVQPLGPDANRWPTVIVIESAHATLGKTRTTTLTVSPGLGCAGFYEQVIYWPEPCDKLKATVFSTFQSPHVLFKAVQVSELNPGLQLYLMPSGPGCTSVKKELFN